MTTRVGVGSSKNRNPVAAGKEAAATALAQAGIDSCDFVMMFATVGYDQEALLGAVREATGNVPLSGCSGEGVIARELADESTHAVGVMVWKSDTLKFKNVKATGLSEDPAAVGKAIGEALGEAPGEAKCLFLMPDGLTFAFDPFIEGFRKSWQPSTAVPLVGGTSGDNYTQTATYEYHNDEVFQDGVSAALLYGDGSVHLDVTHGCVPIGTEQTITKVDGNTIFEIDGKPAFDVMHGYVPKEDLDRDISIINICMGFLAPKNVQAGYDEYAIRVIPRYDEEARTIALYTNVNEGQKFRVTRRDPEKMRQGIDDMLGRLRGKLEGGAPSAVLQFECMGRGRHMFPEAKKQEFQKHLRKELSGGNDLPWLGFYCYGEMAPLGDVDFFHNYTSVIAAITD